MMNKLIRKLSITFSTGMLIMLTHISHVSAEQIEIYTGNSTKANVLFILDQSESMLQPVGATGLTRDQVVKNAFQMVLSQSYQNLSIGFMDYGRDNGAGVDLPVVDINQPAKSVEPGVVSTTETYASMLARFVNNLEGPQPAAQTALVEALLEGAKYYRGDVIDNLSQGYQLPTGVWNDAGSHYRDAASGGASNWRAAGPRTFSGGTGTVNVAGANCHVVGSPAGVPYPECVNPLPGTCIAVAAVPPSTTSAVTHQHGTQCKNPPGSGCILYDATGTECVQTGCLGGTVPIPTHTHAASSNPGTPAYTRCRETTTAPSARNYISPIQSSCDKNFIILLSDGGPTILGSHEQTSIQGFSGTSPCADLAASGFTDPSILLKGKCGPDLVKAISQNDLIPSIKNSTVTTHTIGFQLGGAPEAENYLKKLAIDGGGQFFDANSGNTTQLITILQNLLAGLSSKARTVTTPLATIDLGNPLVNRPETYYSLFDPANSPRWVGNVKGYFTIPNTATAVLGDSVLVDLDLNPALDTNGDFINGSRSLWSTGSDGGNVGAGGFAAKLTNPSSRTIFTDGGSANRTLEVSLTASNFDETDLGLFNLTSTGNAANDNTMVDELIDWARGVDVDDQDGDPTTTERLAIGDVLNSVPIVADYNSGPSRVMYFTTNEGFLHAVDVSDPTLDVNTLTVNNINAGGDELFAYVPSDLLANLEPLRRNVVGNAKLYGLDGALSLTQVGGALNPAGDKYLYAGMRRGGNNYYSLDVSNTSLPTMRWVIEGGVVGTDFEELAQTWSRPSPATIDIGGSPREVIIFGGGYDLDQDANAVRTADDEGRAVFIVDAATGNKLWSAGPDNSHDLNLGLQNSIPGNIAIIDLNADAMADRLYFGDMGGRLWRVDLDANLSNSTGYMLADLAKDASPADNRRFYAEPAVSRLANDKLGIAIGSGYRSHPLDAIIDERLYMIYDVNDVIGVPSPTPSPIVDGSGANAVVDITTNFAFDLNSTVNGWKIELNNGEKINTSVSVLNNKLRITSYIPPSSSCIGDEGTSRLVTLSLSGKPLTNNGVVDPTKSAFENFTTVDNASPGFAEIIYRFIGGGTGGGPPCAGTSCFPPSNNNAIEKRFWMDFDTSKF